MDKDGFKNVSLCPSITRLCSVTEKKTVPNYKERHFISFVMNRVPE